jgi:protein-histidine pros-kinase
MTLKPKFNLVMIAAFAAGLSLASVLVDTLSRRIAREAVLSEAAVMMAALNATVHYTDNEVAPLLARSMKAQFQPQAIPFFVAQRSFDLLAKERPDYTLRQPADNPTNPDDRPAAWEADIIRTFQARPELQSLRVRPRSLLCTAKASQH